MNVDTRIFALASQAGSNEVITPSHETLLALNVVNDGRKPAEWTIESFGQGMYLRGVQQTERGTDKFMILCPSNEPMSLLVLFDAGQNADEVMRWPISNLFLNREPIRIDNRLLSKKTGMV